MRPGEHAQEQGAHPSGRRSGTGADRCQAGLTSNAETPGAEAERSHSSSLECGVLYRSSIGQPRPSAPSQRPELRVTVPVHNTDVPTGTLKSMLRQAGLTAEEFLALINQ